MGSIPITRFDTEYHIDILIYLHCASGSVGGARPCQGRGRGFESRLALFLFYRITLYKGNGWGKKEEYRKSIFIFIFRNHIYLFIKLLRNLEQFRFLFACKIIKRIIIEKNSQNYDKKNRLK